MMCFDIECSKECCKNIKCKRYFLPLIFSPLACFHSAVLNFVYFPIIIGISAFILFWNFPKIVYYTASRPLYYEDLFIDEKKLPNYDVNPSLKNKFQTILEWILIITNTLLVCALADYWLWKMSGAFTTFEILGVTGGIIKIFQMINNTISRVMLKILRKIIKNENIKLKSLQSQKVREIMNLKLNIIEKNHKIDDEGIELTETKKINNRERLNTI